MPSHAPRVLVVDDEPGIRRLVNMILQPIGYDVDTAISGRDAVLLIRSSPPDLILLDLWMPDGDGWVVANMLHALGWAIPIIVISGVSGSEHWAWEIGAADFLCKPFRVSDLRAAVARACPPPRSAAVRPA